MDPFPHLHPRPATGWVNDPNGLGFWDGRWHVMFQWNPHAPAWGDIHWGHVSSPDLVSWSEHPAALAPRPGGIDAGGCWSGVAVRDDAVAGSRARPGAVRGAGAPALVYSATPAGPDEVGVAIARPGPAGTWIQPEAMTLPHPTAPGLKDVRDPFLLAYEGRRLAVQGCRIDDRGAVLLFEIDGHGAWHARGTLVALDDVPDGLPRRGDVWECPQLVPVGERWVLAISWLALDGPRGVVAYSGRLEPSGEGYRFVPESGAELDRGPEFYAPQLLLTDDRVLAVGWADEPPAGAPDGQEWAGTLTLPRELVVDDAGVPSLVPARELAGLRGDALDPGAPLAAPAWWARLDGAWSVSLDGPDGTREVASGSGAAEVWVDGSIVETFDGGGSATRRAYPGPGERWAATGAVAAHRLRRPPRPGAVS